MYTLKPATACYYSAQRPAHVHTEFEPVYGGSWHETRFSIDALPKDTDMCIGLVSLNAERAGQLTIFARATQDGWYHEQRGGNESQLSETGMTFSLSAYSMDALSLPSTTAVLSSWRSLQKPSRALQFGSVRRVSA